MEKLAVFFFNIEQPPLVIEAETLDEAIKRFEYEINDDFNYTPECVIWEGQKYELKTKLKFYITE